MLAPTRRRLAPIAVLALAATGLFADVRAQDPAAKGGKKVVETSVQILTEMNMVPLTIDVGPFGAWARPIIEGTVARFSGEKAGRNVAIQVILRKKGEPEVAVSGRPALSGAEAKDLLGLVDRAGAPRPRVVDFAFRINARVNGGDPDPSRAFEPKLLDPFEALLDRFGRATTAEQVALFRGWARDGAIPILAAAGTAADPRFAGVVGLGKMLAGLDLEKDLDVEALTERNPDFWRATLEMARGNLVTPAARVALHCADGEFAKARRVAEIVAPFDGGKSAASRILGEFRALNAAFDKGFNARVAEGIALHDRRDYAGAIRAYDAAIRDHPGSPWALYERYFSERTLRMERKKPGDEALAGWPEAHKAILARDPLYPSMAQASGKDEMFELVRRMEINGLFKDRTRATADLLAYADIARDLGQDGYASMIYWYAFSGFPPEARAGRDLLEDFLFGLDRLGVKDIKDNFRGDHAAAFARIDADRRKRKDEGPGKAFAPGADPGAKKPQEKDDRP